MYVGTPLNAFEPKEGEDGESTVIEVKPLQSLKASSPIEDTVLGIITDVKPSQPLKAQSPIAVTV
jgi:hypothetical protein